nr:MAG: replication initiator protein [Microvirus sp.]
MLLESALHADSCFVTLTYDDTSLPYGSTLVPEHVRDWLKRIRKLYAPSKIRYFVAGEYGKLKERPHYHAALFGIDALTAGGNDGRQGIVQETWKMGYTYVGELNSKSAGYICKYLTKNAYQEKDGVAISARKFCLKDGRYPEFVRMSLKPGIGRNAIKVVASTFDPFHLKYLEENQDVPFTLRLGKRQYPLGRYLRSALRQELGYGKKASDEATQKFAIKMREMFQEAYDIQKSKGKKFTNLVDFNKGKIQSIEAKFKIHDSKRTL